MDISGILDFFAIFAQNNPKLAGILAVAYLVGLGAKTIREAVEKYVVESPSKKDDEKLEEIKKSKVFKTVEVILDFLLRFKKPNSK